MKDLFSNQSAEYAAFRPVYPRALYDYLFSLIQSANVAWDVGTGNGQVARVLAEHFKKVYATDISKQQLQQAEAKNNIFYSVQSAEQTNFHSSQFDLITVGQAVHWFNFDAFYAEVNRTISPGGVLAIFGYGLPSTGDDFDKIIRHFYTDIVGRFWDKERRYIDDHYRTIPFPFAEIKTPAFSIDYEWHPAQFLGYLGTWSAVQHYKKELGKDPLEIIRSKANAKWGAEPVKNFRFPVLTRVAVVN